MTYSIVARDPVTGAFGVAVASHVLACGAGVPAVSRWGAAASQARAAEGAAQKAIEFLGRGASSAVVGERLMAGDESRSERQLGILDRTGLAWTYTGSHCFAWAGGRTQPGLAVQGNILAGSDVVDAMVDRFLVGDLPFRELMVASLGAGARAGGDARGPQSAALQTARATPLGDERVDLRVDDHPDPVTELDRLVRLYGMFGDVPEPRDLVRLDAPAVLVAQSGLRNAGMAPETPRFRRMADGLSPAPPLVGVGEVAPYEDGWTDEWQRALNDWAELENLELRLASQGWVDPRALERLRALAER